MLCRLKAFTLKSAGWVIAIWMMAAIAGCSGTEVGNPELDDPIVPNDSNIEAVSGDQELETYLKAQYAQSVHKATDGGIQPSDDGQTSPNANENPTSPSAGEHSNTNLHEAGVDESDKVKTDGNYFYIAGDQAFHVVDISGDMNVVATQSVAGYIDELYLYDNKLVVLYAVVQPGDTPWQDVVMPTDSQLYGACYWIPWDRRQGVAVYDVSAPHSPTHMKTVEFEGYLVSSRRIGGKLHIVQQFRPDLPPLYHWHDGTKADKEKKVTANQKAMEEMTLDHLIPHYSVVSDPADERREGPTVSAENFYCPISKDGGGTITTIVTFDLDDATLPFESFGMVLDSHIVYASTRALYITNHRYFFREKISELSMIYKFDLTGDEVRFAGSNILPGWILNQFSLGEYEDVLRVATTTGRAGGWGPTSKNHVYCMQVHDDTLEIIGELKDLAPGEQIYAARFMGDRGYLVTFVQIDPLFTLDLSDPAAPKEAGKLKVPGFSNYIHPYGNDHLITVGRGETPPGIQLSIFDVSDFSNPALLHKEPIGDQSTSTEAAYNHKAFTFWEDRQLMALPIYSYDPYSATTLQGLHVYRVSTDNGFNFLGHISTERDSGDKTPYYYSPWTRGIFVEDQVYAVNPEAVRSAQIDQIEESVQTVYLK